jgi:hypothetical protein
MSKKRSLPIQDVSQSLVALPKNRDKIDKGALAEGKEFLRDGQSGGLIVRVSLLPVSLIGSDGSVALADCLDGRARCRTLAPD